MDRIAEGKGHLELKVLAAGRAALRPGTAAAAEQLEDVGQVAEAQILEIDRRALKRIEAGLERVVAAAIVLGALFRVREHGERFRHLFEPFLRALVAGVDVGMVPCARASCTRP